MGPSVEGVLSLCSNRSASLNKMATMPTYGKKHLKSSSPNQRKLQGCILVYGTRDSRSTKFVQNDHLRLTLDLFLQQVKFASPCICVGKKLKIRFLKMY